jgi:hypothetical protein
VVWWLPVWVWLIFVAVGLVVDLCRGGLVVAGVGVVGTVEKKMKKIELFCNILIGCTVK